MAEVAYPTNATSTIAPPQPPSAKFPLSRRSFFGSLLAALVSPFIAKSTEASDSKYAYSFTRNPDAKFAYAIVPSGVPPTYGNVTIFNDWQRIPQTHWAESCDEFVCAVDVYVVRSADPSYASVVHVNRFNGGSVHVECSLEMPLDEAVRRAGYDQLYAAEFFERIKGC